MAKAGIAKNVPDKDPANTNLKTGKISLPKRKNF